MTIPQAIAESFLPESFVVYGVRLRSLSIGHIIHMVRHDCAFATGATAGLGDLRLAVMICASTYAHFAERAELGLVGSDLARWQRKTAGPLNDIALRIKILRGNEIDPSDVLGFDFDQSCGAMWSYIDYHNERHIASRSILKGGEKGSPPASPEWALLLSALFEMGVPDPFDVPIKQARSLVSIGAERAGATRIFSVSEAIDEQAEADEIVRKIESGEIVM